MVWSSFIGSQLGLWRGYKETEIRFVYTFVFGEVIKRRSILAFEHSERAMRGKWGEWPLDMARFEIC